jgi:hypothetical protein
MEMQMSGSGAGNILEKRTVFLRDSYNIWTSLSPPWASYAVRESFLIVSTNSTPRALVDIYTIQQDEKST